MKGYLLDTNLLIALLWPSHERHDVALKWFTRHRAKGWATCPFTQAGFVRIVSNPAFSRDAVQPREAIHVLSANTAAKVTNPQKGCVATRSRRWVKVIRSARGRRRAARVMRRIQS